MPHAALLCSRLAQAASNQWCKAAYLGAADGSPPPQRVIFLLQQRRQRGETAPQAEPPRNVKNLKRSKETTPLEEPSTTKNARGPAAAARRAALAARGNGAPLDGHRRGRPQRLVCWERLVARRRRPSKDRPLTGLQRAHRDEGRETALHALARKKDKT